MPTQLMSAAEVITRFGRIADFRPVEQAGRSGTTNGAALRVTPVGLAVPADDLARLLDRSRRRVWSPTAPG